MTTADDTPTAGETSIYAEATRETSSGDIILKVVNLSGQAMPVTIALTGAGTVSAKASGEYIAGMPGDQNTVSAPTRVAPRPIAITDAGSSFTRPFPAYSVSVIRLHVTTR